MNYNLTCSGVKPENVRDFIYEEVSELFLDYRMCEVLISFKLKHIIIENCLIKIITGIKLYTSV